MPAARDDSWRSSADSVNRWPSFGRGSRETLPTTLPAKDGEPRSHHVGSVRRRTRIDRPGARLEVTLSCLLDIGNVMQHRVAEITRSNSPSSYGIRSASATRPQPRTRVRGIPLSNLNHARRNIGNSGTFHHACLLQIQSEEASTAANLK